MLGVMRIPGGIISDFFVYTAMNVESTGGLVISSPGKTQSFSLLGRLGC
jgi:hypothetical protein